MDKLADKTKVWVATGNDSEVLGVTASRKQAEQMCLEHVTGDMQADGYSVADIQASVDCCTFDTHTGYTSTRTRVKAPARVPFSPVARKGTRVRVEANCTSYTLGEF